MMESRDTGGKNCDMVGKDYQDQGAKAGREQPYLACVGSEGELCCLACLLNG